ncbi:hypothetical protein [Nitrososphaera sp.]|uniref:hypothetical protein n=1 Tax=Nitrososphaera sp. TaxID=1971748 RepID=UPI002ED984C2
MVLDVASNEELQQVLFLLLSMLLAQRTFRPLMEMKSLDSIISQLQIIAGSMPKPGEKKP